MLYAMSIIHLGNHAAFVRKSFILHDDTFEENVAFLNTPDPLTIMSDVMAVLMAFLADSILVRKFISIVERNPMISLDVEGVRCLEP